MASRHCRRATRWRYLLALSLCLGAILLYVSSNRGRVEVTPSQMRLPDSIQVVVQLANAQQNPELSVKLQACLRSIVTHTSVALDIHILSDEGSRREAEKAVETIESETVSQATFSIVTREPPPVVREAMASLQDAMSLANTSYYDQPVFFTAALLHLVLPPHIDKIIMVDIDVRFEADITQLHALSTTMPQSALFACAHEQQPTYQHALIPYNARNQIKDPRLGAPLPDGQPGLNTGVKLMHLSRMRSSTVYNAAVQSNAVRGLLKKYQFQSNLGDQDYFTLLNFEHPELFAVLPCQWNRQLCTFWNMTIFHKTFHRFHDCTPPYFVYHGNCNTKLPDPLPGP